MAFINLMKLWDLVNWPRFKNPAERLIHSRKFLGGLAQRHNSLCGREMSAVSYQIPSLWQLMSNKYAAWSQSYSLFYDVLLNMEICNLNLGIGPLLVNWMQLIETLQIANFKHSRLTANTGTFIFDDYVLVAYPKYWQTISLPLQPALD